VRRPDIAFIRTERLEGIDLAEVPLPVAPDLVIEIVSKNDRADDLHLKVQQYLAAGVKAVWLSTPTPGSPTVISPASWNPRSAARTQDIHWKNPNCCRASRSPSRSFSNDSADSDSRLSMSFHEFGSVFPTPSPGPPRLAEAPAAF